MKSVKPIVLLSFFFFASVIAEDVTESYTVGESNDISEFDDLDDFDFDNYNDSNDEDIIYSGMISSKKSPLPPPPSSLLKLPTQTYKHTSQTNAQVSCKKWRCKLNGYVPIWKSDVTTSCKELYNKLSWQSKAQCQDKYCEKVCDKF